MIAGLPRRGTDPRALDPRMRPMDPSIRTQRPTMGGGEELGDVADPSGRMAAPPVAPGAGSAPPSGGTARGGGGTRINLGGGDYLGDVRTAVGATRTGLSTYNTASQIAGGSGLAGISPYLSYAGPILSFAGGVLQGNQYQGPSTASMLLAPLSFMGTLGVMAEGFGAGIGSLAGIGRRSGYVSTRQKELGFLQSAFPQFIETLGIAQSPEEMQAALADFVQRSGGGEFSDPAQAASWYFRDPTTPLAGVHNVGGPHLKPEWTAQATELVNRAIESQRQLVAAAQAGHPQAQAMLAERQHAWDANEAVRNNVRALGYDPYGIGDVGGLYGHALSPEEVGAAIARFNPPVNFDLSASGDGGGDGGDGGDGGGW